MCSVYAPWRDQDNNESTAVEMQTALFNIAGSCLLSLRTVASIRRRNFDADLFRSWTPPPPLRLVALSSPSMSASVCVGMCVRWSRFQQNFIPTHRNTFFHLRNENSRMGCVARMTFEIMEYCFSFTLNDCHYDAATATAGKVVVAESLWFVASFWYEFCGQNDAHLSLLCIHGDPMAN